MKKPKVTAENYQEVYRYYGQYEQPKRLATFGCWVMNAAFRPQIEVQHGAEERIEALLAKGTRFVVASNHVSDLDQYVMASLAHKAPAMRALRGNTFVLAKQPLFTYPGLRQAIDIMGGLPAIRVQDAKADANAPADGVLKQAVIDTSAELMIKGKNMGIYPEATRNKIHEIREVQPLKDGLPKILRAVQPHAEVANLPIGVYFGERDDFSKTKPHVFVGMPMEGPFELGTPELEKVFLTDLHQRMQGAVDSAVGSA